MLEGRPQAQLIRVARHLTFLTVQEGSLDKALPLLVERPLILQPPPVAGNTRDLLAIVIRHWVLHRRRRRVNSVLFDPLEEVSFLLFTMSASLAFPPSTPSDSPLTYHDSPISSARQTAYISSQISSCQSQDPSATPYHQIPAPTHP